MQVSFIYWPEIFSGDKGHTKTLDFKKYSERNQCPENDLLCNEAVWLFQSMLLADQKDMDDIAAAIVRIKNNADKINKTLRDT